MRSVLLAIMRLPLMLAGVRLGKQVRVRGFPIIHRHPKAAIVLGDRVVLQSLVKRYHAHMHSPVKLLADHPGAVIRIGEDTRINGACIHAVTAVSIGARCLFAAGVQVLDSNGHESCMQDPRKRIATIDQGRPVVIEDDVWIGLNAIVLPGTLIGAGSIIGAGAVVSGVIPPRSIVRQAVASVSSATAGLVPGGAAWPE